MFSSADTLKFRSCGLTTDSLLNAVSICASVEHMMAKGGCMFDSSRWLLFVLAAIAVGCGGGGTPSAGKRPLIGSGGSGGEAPLVERRAFGVCPEGMNEDSSDKAEQECSGNVGVDVKNESGGVTGRCYAKGDSIVKCTLPGSCTHGFEIKDAGAGRPGRLHCFAPPAPPPPPPPVVITDRCAKHEIRSQAAYDTCLDNCERQRRESYERCQDDGCRGGVNNAKPGCVAGCSGKMRASRDDNCCPGCN